jgi:flagellar biosynthesis GTPase FlhF
MSGRPIRACTQRTAPRGAADSSSGAQLPGGSPASTSESESQDDETRAAAAMIAMGETLVIGERYLHVHGERVVIVQIRGIFRVRGVINKVLLREVDKMEASDDEDSSSDESFIEYEVPIVEFMNDVQRQEERKRQLVAYEAYLQRTRKKRQKASKAQQVEQEKEERRKAKEKADAEKEKAKAEAAKQKAEEKRDKDEKKTRAREQQEATARAKENEKRQKQEEAQQQERRRRETLHLTLL